MGATTTFSVACTADAWTEIADGAAYSSVSLQTLGVGTILLAVGTTAPALDSDAYFAASPSISGALAQIPLTTTDKLYGRTPAGSGTVRGYRIAI